jgi:hypothetical protein
VEFATEMAVAAGGGGGMMGRLFGR